MPRHNYVVILIALVACSPQEGQVPTELTVMSFNAWGGGANDGNTVDQTVAVIRYVDPDVLSLQEVRREAEVCEADSCPPDGPSVAPEIAERLGYHLFEQQKENDALWANAILSKYPIVRATDNDLGVVVDLGRRQVAVLNIHLTDYPYQPYQLLGITYADAPDLQTESEAIAAAASARGEAIDLVLSELDSLHDVDAVFVMGDFNEPSYRDWSELAAAAGRHPLRVRFPGVARFEQVGFLDAYRTVHNDEIAKPGYTWTPLTAADDTDDHHDRIDFILVRGTGVTIESASVVGETASAAEIVVLPWPSDHRAVVADITIGGGE
jgi:endonuclease/exonuclease/phosphatase family metal-dependent hydrolase